ncbi:MAG: hypothetical protein JWQ04_3561 [Pedosphaera sp.]|nr:hypothetical protein [Pedosphaera sp.]
MKWSYGAGEHREAGLKAAAAVPRRLPGWYPCVSRNHAVSIGERARPGRCQRRPRRWLRDGRVHSPWPATPPDVQREGALNCSRGGCAPHSFQLHGYGFGVPRRVRSAALGRSTQLACLAFNHLRRLYRLVPPCPTLRSGPDRRGVSHQIRPNLRASPFPVPPLNPQPKPSTTFGAEFLTKSVLTLNPQPKTLNHSRTRLFPPFSGFFRKINFFLC